jgi:hypothetical protein
MCEDNVKKAKLAWANYVLFMDETRAEDDAQERERIARKFGVDEKLLIGMSGNEMTALHDEQILERF